MATLCDVLGGLLCRRSNGPTIIRPDRFDPGFCDQGFAGGRSGRGPRRAELSRPRPFRVSGLSLGLSAGASINRLFGRVSYLDRLEDFPGIYSAVGLGLALSGGVGGVQLKNANGVIISLEAAKFGLEASANLSAVKITLD